LAAAQAEVSARIAAESGLIRTTTNEPSDSIARIRSGGTPARLGPSPT
jgi:hypothetical protein